VLGELVEDDDGEGEERGADPGGACQPGERVNRR
jgi:hypothetical protein